MVTKKAILMAFVVCFALFIGIGCLGNDSPAQKIERTTQESIGQTVNPYSSHSYGLSVFPRPIQGDRIKIELYDISGGDGYLEIYVLDKDAKDRYYYLNKNRESIPKFLSENSRFSSTIPYVGTFYWTMPDDSIEWDIHLYNPSSMPVTYSTIISVD